MIKIRIGLMGMMVLVCGILMAQQAVETNIVEDTTTVTAAAEEGTSGGEYTFFSLLVKGGPMMYPLCLCSIIMLAFAIERGINLRHHKILPTATISHLRAEALAQRGATWQRDLLREFSGQTSPIARILTAGLRKAGKSTQEIEKAVEDTGEKEAARMRRQCKPLAVIANIAPLLGLLGTVMGMIRAFMTVAAKEDALGRTELLAAGIYQALVTTAVGLTIAIPSLVLYYFYVERVDRLVAEIDDIATDLVERLSMELPS